MSAFHDFARTWAEAARSNGKVGGALRQFEVALHAARSRCDDYRAVLHLTEIGITSQRAGENERSRKILYAASQEARELGLDSLAVRWWLTTRA